MRKNLKNVIIGMLVTVLCLSSFGMVTAAQPTVGEITVSPEEPTQLSEVTFSVEVTGDDIDQVRIKVEECNAVMCYSNLLNESLENTEGNIWTGTATLIHDDTIVGHSWLVIESNGTWYDYKTDKTTWSNFTVVPADEPNGDTNSDDNTGGGTPGFELILVIVSIGIVLYIYTRKRN